MCAKKQIRVLHIMETIQMGGIEQFLFNQYRLLANENIIFDFIVYGEADTMSSKRMTEKFDEMGSTIHSLPHPKKSVVNFIKTFKKLLKHEKYDVVHCHQNYFSGIILPIAQAEGVPVRIAHAHTAQERKKMTLKRKAYHYFMRKAIFFSATHLLGASPMANVFLYKDTRKAEFLPNGINTESFTKGAEIDIRESYSIPKEAALLCHIGNFKPMKNHSFLLNIFSELKRKMKVHMILVGEGKEKENIEKKSKELNCETDIHFLGSQENIASILQECDLFLFPSIFEGLGLSAIEAQVAGLEVIMSDTLPLEIDLGMGLVERLPLDNKCIWIESILSHLEQRNEKDIPEIQERISKLHEKGFSNTSSAKRLAQIYRG